MTVPCMGAARAFPDTAVVAGPRLRWRCGTALGWAAPETMVAGSVTSMRLPSTSTVTVCLPACPASSVWLDAVANPGGKVVTELRLDPPGVHVERPRAAV